MKYNCKQILKILILFIIGGLVYMGMEIAFRGRTHWSMGIVGGMCFIIIGGFNNYLDFEMPVWKQAVCGSLVVTAFELITGIVLNLWLDLGVWDYSGLPLNILGQICLPFTALWIPVSMFAIVLDDMLRWFLFKEEFPHYHWSKKSIEAENK